MANGSKNFFGRVGRILVREIFQKSVRENTKLLGISTLLFVFENHDIYNYSAHGTLHLGPPRKV